MSFNPKSEYTIVSSEHGKQKSFISAIIFFYLLAHGLIIKLSKP